MVIQDRMSIDPAIDPAQPRQRDAACHVTQECFSQGELINSHRNRWKDVDKVKLRTS